MAFWASGSDQRQSGGTRRDGTYGTKGKLQLLDNGRRTTLILLAKVIPNQAVTKHFPFIEQGLDMAEYLMPAAFDRAFAQAMATAK